MTILYTKCHSFDYNAYIYTLCYLYIVHVCAIRCGYVCEYMVISEYMKEWERERAAAAADLSLPSCSSSGIYRAPKGSRIGFIYFYRYLVHGVLLRR